MLEEAALYSTSEQFQDLFLSLILWVNPPGLSDLWEKHHPHMISSEVHQTTTEDILNEYTNEQRNLKYF